MVERGKISIICTRLPPRRFWRACQNFARRAAAGVGELLYPRQCAFCGAELAAVGEGDDHSPHRLCESCLDLLAPPVDAACPFCAAPTPTIDAERGRCSLCEGKRFYFDRVHALGRYAGPLATAMRRAKEIRHGSLVRALGRILTDRHRSDWSNAKFDAVLPMPLHWRAKLFRGGHGVHFLADEIARRLALRAPEKVLYWRRKVLRQSGLPPRERFRNVRNALGLHKGYPLQEARLLLVDDILTTGATASEAARVLRQAGAKRIEVAVVARGLGNQVS